MPYKIRLPEEFYKNKRIEKPVKRESIGEVKVFVFIVLLLIALITLS